MLKEAIIFLVKQLVSHPHDVQLQEADSEQGKLLKLVVNKDDIGKVIGKDGQSIKSIRSLAALFKTDPEQFADITIDS